MAQDTDMLTMLKFTVCVKCFEHNHLLIRKFSLHDHIPEPAADSET